MWVLLGVYLLLFVFRAVLGVLGSCFCGYWFVCIGVLLVWCLLLWLWVIYFVFRVLWLIALFSDFDLSVEGGVAFGGFRFTSMDIVACGANSCVMNDVLVGDGILLDC